MAASFPMDLGVRASEAAALTWVQANYWDTTADTTGDPQTGMYYYDSGAGSRKWWDGAAWQVIGGGGSGDIFAPDLSGAVHDWAGGAAALDPSSGLTATAGAGALTDWATLQIGGGSFDFKVNAPGAARDAHFSKAFTMGTDLYAGFLQDTQSMGMQLDLDNFGTIPATLIVMGAYGTSANAGAQQLIIEYDGVNPRVTTSYKRAGAFTYGTAQSITAKYLSDCYYVLHRGTESQQVYMDTVGGTTPVTVPKLAVDCDDRVGVYTDVHVELLLICPAGSNVEGSVSGLWWRGIPLI